MWQAPMAKARRLLICAPLRRQQGLKLMSIPHHISSIFANASSSVPRRFQMICSSMSSPVCAKPMMASRSPFLKQQPPPPSSPFRKTPPIFASSKSASAGAMMRRMLSRQPVAGLRLSIWITLNFWAAIKLVSPAKKRVL